MVKTKLENNRESAYLSQDLARIRCDLPEYFRIDEASTANIDFPAMDRLFRTLQFRTLQPKLRRLSSVFTPEQTGQPTLFAAGEIPEPAGPYQNHTVIVDNDI